MEDGRNTRRFSSSLSRRYPIPFFLPRLASICVEPWIRGPSVSMRVDKKRRGGGKGEKREKILEPRVERGDRAREAMGEGEGRAVITAQLNRLNNVERPTRRNSRRMSYRSRYFLRRGGAEKKKKRTRRNPEAKGCGGEGSITQLLEMQRSVPLHQSTPMHPAPEYYRVSSRLEII